MPVAPLTPRGRICAGRLGAYAARVATAWSAVRTRYPELPVELLLAAAVAAVITAGVGVELAYSPNPVPPRAGAYLLGVAAAAVLVARRRHPVLVACGGLLIVLVYRLAGYPGEAPGLALFVAFYSVAAYGRRTWTLAGCAVLVLLEMLLPTLGPYAQPWYSFSVLGPAFGLAWMVILGAAARGRRLAAEENVQRAAVNAESRLRERLADERLLIARELHDVLAHTISVIAVQSGLAMDSLDRQPEQARAALLAVRTAAKQAMPELRAALGLLRGDRPDPPDVLAQPNLNQLGDLADRIRANGLRVDLTIADAAGAAPLPPLLELTVYRIVQEALTNVLRHAQATQVAVAVAVRREEGELHIEVLDDGRGPGPQPGSGLGLAGMRERAQLVGGSVTTGPAPSGGFCVSARLPVEMT
jgi:signal transduction histidine kinase